MKDVAVRIKGLVPLLTNRYAGEKPAERKPRIKTQDWIESQRRSRWLDSAHFTQGMFHIPPDMIEGALYGAAAKFRKKSDFKLAVMVVEDFIPLLVNRNGSGYKPLTGTLEQFYLPEFIDLRGVPNSSGQMVEQCRPIFRDWAVEFTIRYDPMIVNEEDLQTATKTMIMGSFRPRFGRVAVEKFEPVRESKKAA